MILVTGAGGNAAGAVVDALAAAGEPVRVLVRRETARRWPEGVEVAVGDLRDQEAVRAALAGVRRVFLLIAEDGAAGFVAAAQGLPLERVVLLSSKSVEEFGDLDNPLYRKHLVGEQAVAGLGVPYTFLRPGGLSSNALRWSAAIRGDGVVRALFPQLAAPLLDPVDLAEVAVRALLDDGHEGRTYTLTGPEIITVTEQIQVLREEVGREIRFEEISEEDAPAVLGPSLPPGFIDVYVPVQKRYLETTPRVLPTYSEVTGKPGRNFREWARANAAAFR